MEMLVSVPYQAPEKKMKKKAKRPGEVLVTKVLWMPCPEKTMPSPITKETRKQKRRKRKENPPKRGERRKGWPLKTLRGRRPRGGRSSTWTVQTQSPNKSARSYLGQSHWPRRGCPDSHCLLLILPFYCISYFVMCSSAVHASFRTLHYQRGALCHPRWQRVRRCHVPPH